MIKDELKDLNETRHRIAEHMPIPANYLLTRYNRLCEKQQNALGKLKEIVYSEDDFDEYMFEELEKVFTELESSTEYFDKTI